jgi:hypothetical protein
VQPETLQNTFDFADRKDWAEHKTAILLVVAVPYTPALENTDYQQFRIGDAAPIALDLVCTSLGIGSGIGDYMVRLLAVD